VHGWDVDSVKSEVPFELLHVGRPVLRGGKGAKSTVAKARERERRQRIRTRTWQIEREETNEVVSAGVVRVVLVLDLDGDDWTSVCKNKAFATMLALALITVKTEGCDTGEGRRTYC
jgi:hypothetical protein